ncbi:hypothetical protein DPEC_G00100960 [Dallia pectoralis]|uniref:Uncharacterized protein n=1 Tax=Dallia pectoralis TaxID=75939 RepID=A0ACC2GWM9_DALPE|nr:hypothetical protein DPEC_G00100960 [Dallia pectoralis]
MSCSAPVLGIADLESFTSTDQNPTGIKPSLHNTSECLNVPLKTTTGSSESLLSSVGPLNCLLADPGEGRFVQGSLAPVEPEAALTQLNRGPPAQLACGFRNPDYNSVPRRLAEVHYPMYPEDLTQHVWTRWICSMECCLAAFEEPLSSV